jgi:hypothetical protein
MNDGVLRNEVKMRKAAKSGPRSRLAEAVFQRKEQSPLERFTVGNQKDLLKLCKTTKKRRLPLSGMDRTVY